MTQVSRGLSATAYLVVKSSTYTMCSKKTCDHIFDAYEVELSVYKDFWHTYYQEYTPSTGIISFPPYLFNAATLPWETVETYIS